MAEIKIIRAHIKSVRQTPRKVGLVAALVRGRNVADALVILNHTPKRAALPVAKAIASAKANALQAGLQESSLNLDQLQVTTGIRLKRFKPAARGRALPYQKRTSHILVEVSGTVKPKKTAAKTTTAAKEAK